MNLYGEAIYNGKPYDALCNGKNFISKGDNALYLFFHDLTIDGDDNVTTDKNFCGPYAFGNVNDKVLSVEWMDNNEQLKFYQSDDMLTIDTTGYPYGMSARVRVAKAFLKED